MRTWQLILGYNARSWVAVGMRSALFSAAARNCLGLAARADGNWFLNVYGTERGAKILRNAPGKMAHEMMGATV
jgi:hypothetical protein